jgi:hypothetical protein
LGGSSDSPTALPRPEQRCFQPRTRAVFDLTQQQELYLTQQQNINPLPPERCQRIAGRMRQVT